MAKIPDGYSLQASPIESAISEGRTKDAERLAAAILRTGKADEVVQRLAADLLDSPPKKRGRPKAILPMHWLEIAEEFYRQRSDMKYEDALRTVAERFVKSESHVRNCVSEYDEAKAAADAETDWHLEQLDRK